MRPNLPGQKDYDPGILWVFKICLNDSRIIADFFIYVNEGIFMAPTQEEAWKAIRTVASRFNDLGIQEAAWK